MKLIDIFNQLAYSELRNVFFGSGPVNDGEDGVPTANMHKFIPSIQAGLTELHKRFLLREGTTTVTLTGATSYTVTPEAGEALMKIERVYGTYNDSVYDIPLNEIGNDKSIRTSVYDTILVPTDTDLAPWLLETTVLTVVYRADHQTIDTDAAIAAPVTWDIDLPQTHLWPLVLFCASRAMNPMGSGGEFHEGNNYWSQFEAACQQLVTHNMSIDSDYENTKLVDRGFA